MVLKNTLQFEERTVIAFGGRVEIGASTLKFKAVTIGKMDTLSIRTIVTSMKKQINCFLVIKI